MVQFEAFPKIPRLNRDMIVTEKIDGTNACVVIERQEDEVAEPELIDGHVPYVGYLAEHGVYRVYAQSRSRIIVPGKNDNAGFAGWVWGNADALVESLQVGRHFGEWWGSGINRAYGLKNGDKRFSLFNVKRWVELPFERYGLDNVSAVPVLYEGPFDTDVANGIVSGLRIDGSVAAPGYMNPEGVIVYHTAANSLFKVTCDKDEKPKGQV